MPRSPLAAFVLTAAPLFGGPALAAPPADETTAAQAQFYEARALMGDGRYHEACPKLEESLRLDHGIGTEYNLADCREHIGEIASAWAGFSRVAAQAQAAGQKEREKIARQRAQALEPRLPWLVVQVPRAIEGLEVRRDGALLPDTAYGTSVPVDPGEHVVVVTAPGKRPWRTRVRAEEGRTTTVEVPEDLPSEPVALTPPPAVAPPPATAPPPAAPPETEAPAGAPGETTTASYATAFPEPVEERSGSPQRIVGYVLGVAGLGGLAIGSIYGLQSISRRDESRSYCVGDLCSARGVELRSEAIDAGNTATLASIAGGAAVLGGLVLVLTAPSGERRAGGLRAVPHVARAGGGVMLEGTLP